MSSVSSIYSQLSSLILGNRESSSSDAIETLIESSDSGITDTVSLSSQSQDLVKSLLSSLDDSSDSGDSTDSIYDILMASQNKKLIQSNPKLVDMILATDESGTASIDDIDLLSLSSDDLLTIIEKYTQLAGSTDTTSTEIDETV